MKDCNPVDASMKPCIELSKKSKAPAVDAIDIAAAASTCEGVWAATW